MGSDNQQVTNEELAWLAGIMDGEGTIRIAAKKLKNSVNHWVFIQVVNTNEELMMRVIELFKILGANPYVWVKPETLKWKQAWQISIQGMGKAEPLLKALKPYLVAKRRHTELVLAFIDSRKVLGKIVRGGGNRSYSDEELSMLNELKRINFRGNLRDFTPDPYVRSKGKKKSDLHGDMQSCPETRQPPSEKE
jgi:intein/homing endonuclease